MHEPNEYNNPQPSGRESSSQAAARRKSHREARVAPEAFVANFPDEIPAAAQEEIPEGPPPEYYALDEKFATSEDKLDYAEYKTDGQGLSSSARVTKDGRIVVSMDIKKALPDIPKHYALDVVEYAVDETSWRDVPPMNIVIMIVGSRGDVQPYLALAKALQKDGHRVRVATHQTFHQFVTGHGIEFYSISGNPAELMSYMVKNPGLMPGMASLTNGDIGRKRKMIKEMINGCWNACFDTDADGSPPFVADAIISNPPAFAHIHCAESLGIPLTMSFTMPWTATAAFPHPLVNVDQSNGDKGLTNFMTYPLADLLVWQGMGDIINKFRQKKLGIPALSVGSGAGIVDRLKVPWTYCMSPDVVGFYFLDLASDYTPKAELQAFLAAGPPPIYIGFGSVVVEDPAKMTEMIFTATGSCGVRAIVSAGWGGLGGQIIPDHIHIIDSVPHDWLFSDGRVAAVIHHGGAGTTAIGLKNGCPTLVVPFFGDQGFWGSMIHHSGAGPEPIHHKELTVEKLVNAIEFLVTPNAKRAAAQLARQIKDENGVKSGVESFYKHLPLLNMRCDLDPSRLAVWWSEEYCLKLSAFAAQVLADKKLTNYNKLELHRPIEYESHRGINDPFTSSAVAAFNTVTYWSQGFAQLFYSPLKGAVNLTTAGPRMVVNVFSSFQEGFHNLPKIYGSKVRRTRKVTGIVSGMTEGVKGFGLSWYDGLSGVVREPMEGAKKSGWTGALAGTARGLANVGVRPAAGLIGLVSQPLEGAWKSVYKTTSEKQERDRILTRVINGTDEVRKSTPQERENVLRRFDESMLTLKERKKEHRDATRWIEPDA